MFAGLGFQSLTKAVSSINANCANLQAIRFATKKAGGSTRNGRDSVGKRLGVKKFGGEVVTPGHIIIRQRGQKYRHGENTMMGRDHTIFSVAEGYVKFTFDAVRRRQVVSVSSVNPNIPKKIRVPESMAVV
jgi:large subunit ribosomal protein L27